MTKMNAKRNMLALIFVVIQVCSVMAMAATGEDAGSRVTIVSSTPEVTVAIDPEVVILTPDVITEGTITAEVFCPNSVGWIERVELTNVNPFFMQEVTLPIPMKLISVEDRIRAKYELRLEIPCSMPAGVYTMTVTATDKDGNSTSGTTSSIVKETLAFSVTDVNFGSVAPGKSHDSYATVKNQGNVRFKFDEPEGIVPSDMSGGAKGTIKSDNIAVNWDWTKVVLRGFFSPGEESREVPFTLSVPFGTLPGRYTGRITFTPTAVE